MRNLSRAELASLVVLTDMANSTHGLAWPSFNTLASRIGTTARHAKTAIKGLIGAGLITVHQQGNRVRSNRYRLNPQPQASEQFSDLESTTSGSDLQNTRVVIYSDTCSDLQSPKVVMSRAPKSINQSEHKAKIDDRATGEGADAPSCPLGASGLQPPEEKTAQDRYPEFWQAMPMRTTVAQAETLISNYLITGVPYQDIINGAKRYSTYCQTSKSPRRQSAANWLTQEKWRDDWTSPSFKATAKVSVSHQNARKIKRKTNPSSETKETRQTNPDFLAWRRKRRQLFQYAAEKRTLLSEHFKTCKSCNNALNSTNRTLLCGIGKSLVEQEKDLDKQELDMGPAPERYLNTQTNTQVN